MRHRDRPALTEQARSLFTSGQGTGEISKALHVGRDTLRAWRRRDEKERSTTWEADRAAAIRRRPQNVLRALEAQFADLVATGPNPDELAEEPGLYERRLYRLAQTIARFRASSSDLTQSLLAMSRLAEWAARHTTDSELATLHDVFERYMNDLHAAADELLA